MRQSLRVVIALAVGIGALACKKGTSDGMGGGLGKTVGGTASAMKVFPKEITVLGGVSFAQVRKVKGFEPEKIAAQIEAQSPELAEVKKECGFNLLTDFESITMGLNIETEKVIMVLKGKFDEAKVNNCLTTMAKKKGEEIEIKKDGKLVEYAKKGGSDETLIASWISSDTVALAPKESKELLLSALEGKSSVEQNQPLMDLVKKTSSSGLLWGAGLIPEQAAAGMTGPLGWKSKPTGAYATLDASQGLAVKIGARFPDEAGAKDAVSTTTTQIEGMKGMLPPDMAEYAKAIKLEAQGNDAVIQISLTEKQVEDLGKKLQGMMGMMGGM